MKFYAFSALATAVLADTHPNTGDVDHPADTPLDLDASTKLVGIIGWGQFINNIIDNQVPKQPSCEDSASCGEDPLDESHPDYPNYPTDRDNYICAYRWSLFQPFSVSTRYALFVGHNCPAEIVESFSFELSLTGYGADSVLQADRDHEDSISADGDDITVSFSGLLPKLSAGSDPLNDGGLYLSASYDADTLAWSYLYTYAPGTWLQ